jgi:ethanolamine ammonia-lyase small subunit
MNNYEPKVIEKDPWKSLKKYTQARIAIGHCGSSIPTDELLQFKLAHAKAMDAVHLPLKKEYISFELEKITSSRVLYLHSQARTRSEYLRRPDWGRALSDESKSIIENLSKASSYDISLVVADGLSSTAIERNIIPVMRILMPELKQRDYSLSPVAVVEQGRVAVVECLNAQLTIIFIGERPGLKSPDSLGIYMTYNPKSGTTDERRNCISNVRQGGLSYHAACFKLLYLIDESFKRKISGVDLKDEQSDNILEKGSELINSSES